jgi:hypothetical protein
VDANPVEVLLGHTRNPLWLRDGKSLLRQQLEWSNQTLLKELCSDCASEHLGE